MSLEYLFKKNQFNVDELEFINSLNLISLKPMLYVCNVDEKSIISGNKHSQIVQNKAKEEANDVVIISASIESQIAELENNDEKLEMIREMGLSETTLSKVIKSGYNIIIRLNTIHVL